MMVISALLHFPASGVNQMSGSKSEKSWHCDITCSASDEEWDQTQATDEPHFPLCLRLLQQKDTRTTFIYRTHHRTTETSLSLNTNCSIVRASTNNLWKISTADLGSIIRCVSRSLVMQSTQTQDISLQRSFLFSTTYFGHTCWPSSGTEGKVYHFSD